MLAFGSIFHLLLFGLAGSQSAQRHDEQALRRGSALVFPELSKHVEVINCQAMPLTPKTLQGICAGFGRRPNR